MSQRRSLKRLAAIGLLATVTAVLATTLTAAVAGAAGVDLEVSDGEAIPLSGIAFVTGVFSVVGVVIAAALQRWSVRPAETFVRATLTLTALSLVPPFLTEADSATVITLLGLHLVAAVVMIPTLARALRQEELAATHRVAVV